MFSSKTLPASSTAVAGKQINMTMITLTPSSIHSNITNLAVANLPSICFSLGSTISTRCLKIFLVSDPYEVQLPGYYKASPEWIPRGSQATELQNLQAGVTYTFKIVGKHEFANDTLSLELRSRECVRAIDPAAPPCPSPELPNMRWLGPAQCFRPGPGGCSFTPATQLSNDCSAAVEDTCVLARDPSGRVTDFRNWNWYRMLQYTPRGIEIGNTYRIAFQGVAPGAFTAQSGAPALPSFAGAAYGAPLASQAGGAPFVSAAYSCAGPLASFADYRYGTPLFGYHQFQVIPKTGFDFDTAQRQQPLLDPAAGGAPFSPPWVSADPWLDPADGAGQASVTFYVNCPTRVGYYSRQPGTVIFPNADADLGAFPGMAFRAGAAYPCRDQPGLLCPYAEVSRRPGL